MKNITKLFYGFMVVAIVLSGVGIVNNATAATIEICHQDNGWMYMETPNQSSLAGHLGHGDFEYAGPPVPKNSDIDEAIADAWCQANVPTTGTLTIVKEIVGTTDLTKEDFGFKINEGGTVNFEADGTNSIVLITSSGPFTVTEVDPGTGFNVTYDGCTNINLTEEGATCTITNTVVVVEIPGCTDPEAINYDPEATEDDDSCQYPEPGTLVITLVKTAEVTEQDAEETEITYTITWEVTGAAVDSLQISDTLTAWSDGNVASITPAPNPVLNVGDLNYLLNYVDPIEPGDINPNPRTIVWELGAQIDGASGEVSFAVEAYGEVCNIENTATAAFTYGDDQNGGATSNTTSVESANPDCDEPVPQTSDVTLCKYNGNEQLLSGWTLKLNDGTEATENDHSGLTGENGCVTFQDVPFGNYEVAEVLQAGWANVAGLVDVVVDSETETFYVINRELAACEDGIDNDEDGKTDFVGEDPGCENASDDDETNTTSTPECSDNSDNGDSEDELADELDLGCWTDPNDSESYDPNDNDETNPSDVCPNDNGIQTNTNQCSDDDNGGGSSSSGSRRSGGSVLGAATDVCGWDTQYLRRSWNGNVPNEVETMQNFLNLHMNSGLVVDNTFGPKTEAAVNAFQIKYMADILAPWGLSKPTGIWYISTTNKAKEIMCGEKAALPALINWSKNPLVSAR